VSGISTGALIAPFAFIGTSEAYDEIIRLYQGLVPRSVHKRGLLSYLPGSSSFYDVSLFREQVNSAITPDLIGKMADGAIQGRQLLIGATNLDYALLRTWDLAHIASGISTEKAIEKTVSILTASTALPVMFPPEIIDNHLYADGGIIMNIVSGVDERYWAYQAASQSTEFVENGTPIKIRVWIVVNDKMHLDPTVIPLQWPSILERTLKTAIKTSALQNIQDAETYVQLINDRPEFDAQLRYVAIPQSFPIKDTEEITNPETIQSLIELGLKMGADPTSWITRALRPGAPF
jgi:predicted acylesterase/phospholipase RssA